MWINVIVIKMKMDIKNQILWSWKMSRQGSLAFSDLTDVAFAVGPFICKITWSMENPFQAIIPINI
jgi:hypothetical protein